MKDKEPNNQVALCAILNLDKPLELLAINQNLDCQKLIGEDYKTSKDVIDVLSNNSQANELILSAAKNDINFGVQFALACDANIDATDYKKNCPLHLAVKERHLEMVNLLLANGAKTDLMNVESLTPLNLSALSNGNVEIARLLLEKDSSYS